MDTLLNEFTVNRPINEAWEVLTDVERIAPCMPGAQLKEIEGDVFRGVVKVKLGAISTEFKGQASFTERDDTAHRAVLKAEGRDIGGKGNADAVITARLESVSPNVTKCAVETELRVTGKVAQFGRGIMADVSKKLMNQFATNLNAMLDEKPTADAAETSTTPASASPASASPAVAGATATGAAVTGAAGAGAGPAGAAAPTGATGDAIGSSVADAAGNAASGEQVAAVRKIEGPAAEPIELSGLAGGAILKRLLPALGGFVVLLLVFFRRRK